MNKNKIILEVKDKEVYEFLENEFVGQLSDGHYENSKGIGDCNKWTTPIWEVIEIIHCPDNTDDFKVLTNKRQYGSVKEAFKTEYFNSRLGNPYDMILSWKRDGGYDFILDEDRFNEKTHTWKEVLALARKAARMWNGN